MRKTIFVVDDNDANLAKAEEALEKQYRIITLPSAARMFKTIEKLKPDLILLDVKMPDIDGFRALKRLKKGEESNDIPVIFLTGLSDGECEARGIEMGAVDFITKPFTEAVLLNRIKHHLHIDELIRDRTGQLSERTDQLMRLQNGIVHALADLVEKRDDNTGGHIDRTTVYIKILVDAMIKKGLYKEEMQDWDMELVISSARLHDVGKIAAPDAILNKPGKLTPEEFEKVKKHAAEGERIVEKMVIQAGGDMEFLQSAKMFAAYHHERWDGRGYPYQLKGEEIPLHGRIMSIVDVYDALISERPYKKAFSNEKAIAIIAEEAGKAFDPKIVDVFLPLQDKLAEARLMLDAREE